MTQGMSGVAKIQFVKDWRKEMGTSLTDALAVTHEMCGRSLAQAVVHAIILMAKSMASPRNNLTRIAPKRRKVKTGKYGRYVTRYSKSGKAHQDYRWMFPDQQGAKVSKRVRKSDYFLSANRYARKTWDQAQKISNRGLARRSWMWGLAGLRGAGDTGRSIPGAVRLRKIIGKLTGGLVIENRLKYIGARGILAAGWEATAQNLAANKILGQARDKLERGWKNIMERGAFKGQPGDRQPDLGKYLRQEAA